MALSIYKTYSSMELGLTAANATTGVWTLALSSAGVPSGMVNLHKAAAASTSVVHFPIPRAVFGSLSVIEVFYLVTTANLTSAPTAVLNKYNHPGKAGTGLAALTAIAQSLTFAGVDTVGTASGAGANGSHIAVITVTTPVALQESEAACLQLTMNEAATSVLDVFGISVTYV